MMRLALLLLLLISCKGSDEVKLSSRIDGDKCLDLVQQQVDFGPRYLESEASTQTLELIAQYAKEAAWEFEIDEWDEVVHGEKTKFRNAICTLKGEQDKFIVFGSHYDTKKIPEYPNFASANDGASSTALLMDMMKLIKPGKYTLKFVFFDGEECQKNYSHNDGLHGSKRFVQQLVIHSSSSQCKAMILADLIGDKDLHVAIPANGNEKLKDDALRLAQNMGVSKHFSKSPNSVLDDHVPFHEVGIPAIDLIDFDYGPNNSYWHTEEDTVDKLSAESFEIVGELMLQILESLQQN